ncbi:putative lipase domain protein [Trypanosoma rangeli]|uniref:Putative lipase domain protein n=1 Tax=Trypanosoma rangeli TaxID=5698 RepID=A0A3R7NGC6_TRYRA|nr:putative lipase domain protein [Trypanosoma rangeli]RNF06146.1 putative lipase domain protein [Trypanosoma rangeli]|eukprot:RNF06146.1 putative lipase domain protein [Trypanosoma rangeli]
MSQEPLCLGPQSHVKARAAEPVDVSDVDSVELGFEAPVPASARGQEEHLSDNCNNAGREACRLRKSMGVIPRAPRRNLHSICSHQPPARPSKKDRRGFFYFSRGLSSEPVELQIEGLSPFVAQAMLYMWYAVIIAATVLQSMDFAAWGVMNICGEEVSDLRHYDKWSSPCVTSTLENAKDELYTIRWEEGPYGGLFKDLSVRFPRVVLSLAFAGDREKGAESVHTYKIEAVISHIVETNYISTFWCTVTCAQNSSRCDYLELPAQAVLNDTSNGKKSLTLRGVPAPLARVIANSSVGIVFQRYAYSLGAFIWRYVFLLLSFLHLLRFIVYKKFTSTLHEQSWVVVLQLALFWYLNPLHALDYSKGRPSLVLHFLESHFPTWFVAVCVGFMLSAITATMPWTPPAYGQQPVMYNLLTMSGIKGYFRHSASVYDPPLWTKYLVVAYVLLVVALDIVGESLHAAGSLETWGEPESSIHYVLAALILLGCIICCILLVHVHRNMGAKSYLDSRPQQLAARFLILIFVTSLLYFIFHVIMFCLRYRSIPGMTMIQPMIQLPALMVSSFLVNIMTLIYTTRKRGDLVPIHPRDERWKLMVWPDTWYRWLSRHGGSMYIFHTEEEELTFNWNQIGYRVRQQRAKAIKRKGRKGGSCIFGRARSRVLAQRFHNARTDDEQPSEVPETCSVQGDSPPVFVSPPTESHDGPAILNMDRTSTWFLPARASHTFPLTMQHGLHGSMPPVERKEHEHIDECDESRIERQATKAVYPSESDERRCRPSQQVPDLSAFPSVCEPREVHFEVADKLPLDQRHCRLYSGVATERSNTVAHEEADDVEEEEEEEEEVNILQNVAARTFGRARERMDFLIRGAERTFISWPLNAFEHLETFILDAAARTFQDVEYLPFFNLETAISCFNLSWEAYGTSHRGEKRVERWKPFSLTRLCCGCCCSSSACVKDEVRVPVANSAALTVAAGNETPLREDESGNRIAEHFAEPGQGSLNAPPPIDVERYGYRLCAVLEAMDVQVVISALDNADAIAEGKAPRIVIAFRGTMSMSNAWQDLRFRRVVWGEMVEGEPGLVPDVCCGTRPTVHVGFLSIWNAHREHVCGKLWEELLANPSTVYRVFCTGHSLGGALATLCAYSLCRLLRQNNYALAEVTVYTYGQPPIGNKAFQTAYNKAVPRTFRVVNESDVVGSISMYGSHVGIEVNIDRHGNYICKPTYMERLFRPMKGKGFAVENHLMESYSASLNAIAKGTSCPSLAYAGDGSGDNAVSVGAVSGQREMDMRVEKCA